MTGEVERPYGRCRCRYPLTGDTRNGWRSTALAKLKCVHSRRRGPWSVPSGIVSAVRSTMIAKYTLGGATCICTVGDQMCAIKCVCVLGKRALERCMLGKHALGGTLKCR